MHHANVAKELEELLPNIANCAHCGSRQEVAPAVVVTPAQDAYIIN
jgi:hypothetical protein